MLGNTRAVRGFLNEPGLNIGIVEFIEERKHPIQSTREIAELALNWAKDHRTDAEIREPVPKILLVLEEAHTLIPEWDFNPVRTLQDKVSKTVQIVLQARKYGLGFMVITQRTANVTKSILNQCNSICAFQAYDETGFDFMKNYMGEHYVRALPNLKRRHGVLVGKASQSDRPIIVRYHDQVREIAIVAPPNYVPPDQEADLI
jgi:DNA helicase HerA-like ATPase